MRRDIVVVGASAGGVEALRTLAAGLPPDLPATVLIVLHMPTYSTSALAAIIGRAGPLSASTAKDGEPLPHGAILVAPPDRHLAVMDGHARLTRGPRENGHRPAVDVLFRTAARARGRRVIGVVLSGVLDDGTAGLLAVHQRGGLTIAQDPSDALYAAMPQSAIDAVPVDHVVPAADLGALLGQLCAQRFDGPEIAVPELMDVEAAMAVMDDRAMNADDRPGEPAAFACPDCGGTLFRIDDEPLMRFRCRVGHAWSSEALLGEQNLAMEGALWMALRSLEERAALSTQLGERSDLAGNTLTARRFRDQAAEAKNAASLLREMLERGFGDDAALNAINSKEA